MSITVHHRNGHDNIPTVIVSKSLQFDVPLNLDLRISSQLGWVSIASTYSFTGFSPIPFDDFSTNSLFNPLVNGSAMLSLDFT